MHIFNRIILIGFVWSDAKLLKQGKIDLLIEKNQKILISKILAKSAIFCILEFCTEKSQS
jgi:hypothetical protein